MGDPQATAAPCDSRSDEPLLLPLPGQRQRWPLDDEMVSESSRERAQRTKEREREMLPPLMLHVKMRGIL